MDVGGCQRICGYLSSFSLATDAFLSHEKHMHSLLRLLKSHPFMALTQIPGYYHLNQVLV